MILRDSGPLFSIIDPRQQHHRRCAAVVESLIPLVTTWPCLTEAMYFLGRSDGWRLQSILWDYLNREIVELHDLSSTECHRVEELIRKFHDTPMDLADASLVVTAESLRLRRIFTLDSDFRIYRTADGGTFEMVPE